MQAPGPGAKNPAQKNPARVIPAGRMSGEWQLVAGVGNVLQAIIASNNREQQN
jgi:hypothetical protein